MKACIEQQGGTVVMDYGGNYQVNYTSYCALPSEEQRNMFVAASAGVQYVVQCEPRLYLPHDAPITLRLQRDVAGERGDVRDLLCVRIGKDWEVGISCKHNHEAVKHSRLSSNINFGEKWLGHSCSADYFNEIRPVFNHLEELRLRNCLWRDVPSVHDTIYRPVLDAFLREMDRLNREFPEDVPPRLVQYLIGNQSFYKIVAHDSMESTSIQAFNLDRKLNSKAATKQPEIRVGHQKLPTRIDRMYLAPNRDTTAIINCDNGWSLSLRIHSASGKVEPSLKFDIQLGAVPPSLEKETRSWHSYAMNLDIGRYISDTLLYVAEHGA